MFMGVFAACGNNTAAWQFVLVNVALLGKIENFAKSWKDFLVLTGVNVP